MPTTARIAILLEEGFDDDELEQIVTRVQSTGLEVVLVAPRTAATRGGNSARPSHRRPLRQLWRPPSSRL
jgi:hypothetical protein